MADSIHIDLLYPADHEDEIIDTAAEIAESKNEYELFEKGVDLTGTLRIIFARNDFDIELRATASPGRHQNGTVATFYVEGGRLDDATKLAEADNLASLIGAVKDIYSAIESPPVMCYGVAPNQPLAAPTPDSRYPSSPRRFISWLDLYPPTEVEQIGRDTLLSAPAPRVEELDDGSILIVSKHPFSDDAIEDVADHIGIPFWGDDPGLVS
ncbi:MULTISPECIES: hypothetical protein [Halomicrobium]|uniref:Uncharacterized protein n=2 Tax=Halomicrobium mukohataei TaxID=57705 RepID=C7NWG0_HALMD|nr:MULTISPECIES: hypothetical protein [Halomicrobium]ACV46301.1 hypothetical protein Hmuk_0164 [Halomicrobium mukohataei DSM 12286]QCD64860.1 hypothetical protein E5139_04115 [Halomicrobium mukohataei]QFR19666.1 hypothetical protein GBQ70_04110 [Halomicrobium sp. ZPS1]